MSDAPKKPIEWWEHVGFVSRPKTTRVIHPRTLRDLLDQFGQLERGETVIYPEPKKSN